MLVWPYGFEKSYALPLALGYLANSIKNMGHDLKIVDCCLEDQPAESLWFRERLRQFQPDVVGVSAWSILFPEALNVLSVAKQELNNVTTLLGGPHATSHAESVLEYQQIDYVIRGEGEKAFPEFLDFLMMKRDLADVSGLCWMQSGQMKQNATNLVQNVDELPLPDYDIIQLERYWKAGYRYNTKETKNAPLWMTRGCPYKCTFCAAPVLNGRPVRTHSISYLIKWIEYLYHEKGVRWFNIIDDNFTFHVPFAKEFCREVIKLNLKDIGFGTPNGIRFQRGDRELWDLMKQAGWKSLIIAPESGSQRVLKLMKKHLDLSLVPPAVKEIKKAGLTVQGLFLIGYPGETLEDIKKTSEFIKKCRFNFIFLNVFQPLPGTPVYQELVSKGEIKDGLLPNNYSEGTRSYVTKDLVGFNFPFFVLKTYALLALRDPLNIPNLFSFFDKKFLAKKLFANFSGMLKPTAKGAIVSNSAPLPTMKSQSQS